MVDLRSADSPSLSRRDAVRLAPMLVNGRRDLRIIVVIAPPKSRCRLCLRHLRSKDSL